MKILVIIPTQYEYDCFLKSWIEQGHKPEDSTVGRLPTVRFPELNLTLSLGGLGKVMFAVQTQHLLDCEPDWDLVICAGAAGGLVDYLSVGDIVIATETIEHDIKNKFGKPRMPSFKGDANIITMLQEKIAIPSRFQIFFGGIASGDEDVVEEERVEELKSRTGAIAVAWEGAGGARACQFSRVPYVEIRGISDKANSEAPSDFEQNLPVVMENMAELIRAMTTQLNNIYS